MDLCFRCGMDLEKPKRCSKCRVAVYCSERCQRIHWKTGHRQSCKNLMTMKKSDSLPLVPPSEEDLKRQQESIKNGTLHFEFLNPRSDRSIEVHGNDTVPVMKMDAQVREFIKTQLHLPMSNVGMMYIDSDLSLLGPYGCCDRNAQYATLKTGSGKAIFGWALYKGKYMVEAEGHTVWKAPSGEYCNVTLCKAGVPQPGYFVADYKNVAKYYKENGKKFPSNKVYWL